MSDLPGYDPDRPFDLDPGDLDAVSAYLEHPNTVAHHDDLARSFEHLPPEDKRAAWEQERREAVGQWQQVVDALISNPQV